MDLGLKGKVAVVLAASKGMGRSTALALAAEGARLAICARTQKDLDKTAEEIEAAGAEVLAQVCDVTSEKDRRKFLDAVLAKFKTIHVLVTNGGGPPTGLGLTLDSEAWAKAAERSLLSVIHWTRAVAPMMVRQKWGRILHIESVTIKQPVDGLILSNTMRAGVAGFAKSMARELAPHNVLVNVLCPGFMDTERLKSNVESRAKDAGVPVDDLWKTTKSGIPLGRIGNPDEFGAVAAFLASEKASYITGTVLQVDGGLYRGLL